jgi:hypothetical protein
MTATAMAEVAAAMRNEQSWTERRRTIGGGFDQADDWRVRERSFQVATKPRKIDGTGKSRRTGRAEGFAGLARIVGAIVRFGR